MVRARLLVIKAHQNLAHPYRERILVTSFLIGLYDQQLAASIDVAGIQNAADAERLAVEGEAVRHDQRSRRSNLNLLHEEAIIDDSDDFPGADLLMKKRRSLQLLLAASVQLVVPTLNQANDLRTKRRQVPLSATFVGNMGTSKPIAPDQCDHQTDALYRVPRWSACCATATTLCTIAPRWLLQSRCFDARLDAIQTHPNPLYLAPRQLTNQALPSNATAQQYFQFRYKMPSPRCRS